VEGPFSDAVRAAEGPVVVDMSAVTFVASPGIQMLLSAHRVLRGTGRPLMLNAINPRIRRTFETIGIFRVIPERTE
jgi:anti-anti-sigma factor